MAFSASARFEQSNTPLPRARPSALTAQHPPSDSAKALAGSGCAKAPERAVGMPCRSMKAWEKTFDASNCAAFRLGPQTRNPCCWKRSTMPSASGLSGPTTVRSGRRSWASARSPARSSAPILTHWTGSPPRASRSPAMPALPGAHHIRQASGDWASFQTSACSRPPEPITSSFMRVIEPPNPGSATDFCYLPAGLLQVFV